MRRILLLTMMLAMTVSGLALANGSDAEEPAQPIDLGVTLTCATSGQLLSIERGACTLTRRIATIGNLEVELSLDGQLSFNEQPGYLGAFVAFVYYAPSWFVFAELATPSIITPQGGGDLWRLGFSTSF